MTRYTGTLRFTLEDLACFSAASHDGNPLHMSEDYARKTPYGERVVFGVLGGLACLGLLRDRSGQVLSSIAIEFSNPMFVGIDYTVEISEVASDQVTARVYDGRWVVLKAVFRFRVGAVAALATSADSAPSPRGVPADRSAGTLAPGGVVEGVYAPAWDRLGELIARFGLEGKGAGPAQLAGLLWSSYLVGMELPGRRALFARLTLDWETAQPTASLAYSASVRSFDQRFNLLRLDVQLACGAGMLAKGEIRSFVREDAPGIAAPSAIALEHSERLTGQVALVIGASRGLGARIAQALALRGCIVLASFLKSAPEAEALRANLAGAPGQIVPVQGDGGDLHWCLDLKQRILKDYGRLDILVCNACPALRPLWLEVRALERIQNYITRSLELVSVPMAAFLELLTGQAGKLVVVSSEYATTCPAEWPHYVAAKSAIEGLTRVAAHEYPEVSFLIARPPRLLTDLSNNPSGQPDAMPPERAAAAIGNWLSGPTSAERVETLEVFA